MLQSTTDLGTAPGAFALNGVVMYCLGKEQAACRTHASVVRTATRHHQQRLRHHAILRAVVCHARCNGTCTVPITLAPNATLGPFRTSCPRYLSPRIASCFSVIARASHNSPAQVNLTTYAGCGPRETHGNKHRMQPPVYRPTGGRLTNPSHTISHMKAI